EDLADAVIAVGTVGYCRVDALGGRVEAHGVDRAGIDDALDAAAPRRLEDIVGADDVGLEDSLEAVLDADRAEMNDGAGALGQALDRRRVGEIGEPDRLARQRRA